MFSDVSQPIADFGGDSITLSHSFGALPTFARFLAGPLLLPFPIRFILLLPIRSRLCEARPARTGVAVKAAAPSSETESAFLPTTSRRR